MVAASRIVSAVPIPIRTSAFPVGNMAPTCGMCFAMTGKSGVCQQARKAADKERRRQRRGASGAGAAPELGVSPESGRGACASEAAASIASASPGQATSASAADAVDSPMAESLESNGPAGAAGGQTLDAGSQPSAAHAHEQPVTCSQDGIEASLDFLMSLGFDPEAGSVSSGQEAAKPHGCAPRQADSAATPAHAGTGQPASDEPGQNSTRSAADPAAESCAGSPSDAAAAAAAGIGMAHDASGASASAVPPSDRAAPQQAAHPAEEVTPQEGTIKARHAASSAAKDMGDDDDMPMLGDLFDDSFAGHQPVPASTAEAGDLTGWDPFEEAPSEHDQVGRTAQSAVCLMCCSVEACSVEACSAFEPAGGLQCASPSRSAVLIL